MRILLVTSFFAFTSLSVVAAADPTPDIKKMASDDCARARKLNKTCVLTIGAEDVDGKVPTVSDPTIAVQGFDRLNSLIRLRRDFVLEIIKTAEDL